MVGLLSVLILPVLKSFQCYVLRVMPGLRSFFAGDEMAGIGNAGFGFAADYRFFPGGFHWPGLLRNEDGRGNWLFGFIV